MITDIGQKLKNIRELKNLKQEYVAERLGISTRAYSKIETEETQLTIKRLNEISEILGVSPQEIIGFETSIVFNNGNNQNGGEYSNTIYNQTEIEHVERLYKKLLEEKERTIQLLMEKKSVR